MGLNEENVQGKTTTSVLVVPTSQEVPTTASVYSVDWQSMTAYYGGVAAGAPPAFFSPPSQSPYMWGGQHLLHPYGTSLPYHAIYPPGMYPFPPMTQGVAIPATEFEARPEEGKDRNLTKKSEVGFVCVNQATGKSINGVREKCTSTNDDASPSGGSGTEDSSTVGDQMQNQQDMSVTRKGSENRNLNVQFDGNVTETAPATNLNIGMDIWNESHTGSLPRKEKLNPVNRAAHISPVIGQNGVMTGNHWVQDERELKRQKRKESNRDSARRSRQRKQQECEELSKKVEELTGENTQLRNEMEQINQQCKALESENASLKKELDQLGAPESPSTIDGNNNKFTSHPIQSTVK